MIALSCRACGTELGPRLLICPSCHALVHSAELSRLSNDAQAAEAAGELALALERWRAALQLLPSSSRQAAQISERVSQLATRADEKPKKSNASVAAAASAVVVGLLGKGKLLLLGLTKMSTVLSMLLSLGAYWAAFGWRFAVGLLALMYVHEMGHVAALRRYGIAASAPMFVPGLGAFVRLNERLNDVREDARVGLAGPIWGTAAAIVPLLVYLLTDWQSAAAIARVGAWLNLFNLMPVWQLDGGRAFNALKKSDRLFVALWLVACWAFTEESLVLLIALAAGGRAWMSAAPNESDKRTLFEYAALAAVLSAMTMLKVTA